MSKNFKKRLLCTLMGAVISAGAVYGAEENKSFQEKLAGLQDVKLNYELKVGITPYEKIGSKSYSEDFSDGLDFGMEVYKPFEKYSIGFGGEVKGKLHREYIKDDGERLYTYYLLGKRKIGNDYSLVARLGKTTQNEFRSKYYAAAGLEKSFGRVNVQLLAEKTRLESSHFDKDYTMVGLKIGYVFGDMPQPEVPMMVAAVQEPVFKLVIEGDELTGGYEAYKTEIPTAQVENIQMMTKQLNDYDKAGRLEMTAYSDNTGSKQLNVDLANERMDNLEKEFRNNGLTEKVRVEKVNPENTVKNIYKVDNDTFENRKLNRRIEVSFFEDEVNETAE